MPPAADPRQPTATHLLCLAAILALLSYGAAGEMGGPLPFDARAVYFPMAARWNAEGWTYLLDSDSTRAAPLTWMWPAWFGNDAAAIERAHLALALLTAALLFDLGRRLHSAAAGLLTALLFALAPQLRSLLVAPLSEPLFFALTVAWWWALAVAVTQRGLAWLAAVALAGLAGGLAMLTRPLWLYPCLAAAVVAAALAWRLRAGPWRTLAVGLALTLALPAAQIAKNAATFGLAAVATGQGNALYFGNHPVTGGFEPPRFGLQYDDGSIAGPGGGLTLGGDARLTAAAPALIAARSAGQHAHWAAHKLRAIFLPLPDELALPRVRGTPRDATAMRAFLLLAATLGVVMAGRHPLVALLAVGLLVQTAQLLLVLYNGRYNVGALEPALLVLAGVGSVAAWLALHARLARRWAGAAPNAARPATAAPRPAQAAARAATPLLPAAAATLVLLAGLGAATWALVMVHRALPLPAAQLDGVPTRVWLDLDQAALAALAPATPQEAAQAQGAALTLTAARARLAIPVPDLWMGPSAQLLWRIELAVQAPEAARCGSMQVDYAMDLRTPAWSPPQPPPRDVALTDHGRPAGVIVGATYGASAAFPGAVGVLRLALACPPGTVVTLQRVQLHEQLRLWTPPAAAGGVP